MIRSSKTNELNELSLIETIIVKFLNSWYVYS